MSRASLSDCPNLLYQPLFTYERPLNLLNFSSILEARKPCLRNTPDASHDSQGNPSVGLKRNRNEISPPRSSLILPFFRILHFNCDLIVHSYHNCNLFLPLSDTSASVMQGCGLASTVKWTKMNVFLIHARTGNL